MLQWWPGGRGEGTNHFCTRPSSYINTVAESRSESAVLARGQVNTKVKSLGSLTQKDLFLMCLKVSTEYDRAVFKLQRLELARTRASSKCISCGLPTWAARGMLAREPALCRYTASCTYTTQHLFVSSTFTAQ